MLATLRSPGTGIGMMSPRGPAWARKRPVIPLAETSPTILWNAEPISLIGSPAATMLGCQTGM